MNGDILVGEWLVEPRLARASKDGRTVHLRAKVAELLVFFAQHPGEVVPKDVLLEQVWGTEHISESALTSVVTELRQTFGDDPANPWLLQTIPKQGYRLIAPVRPASESATGSSMRSLRWIARMSMIGGTGMAVLLLAGWAASYRSEVTHSPVVTRAVLEMTPAKSLALRGGLGYLTGRPPRTAFTLSPDGRLLVFAGIGPDDRPRLYLRRLDEFTAHPIAGTDPPGSPVFSPDGRWVAYWVVDPNSAVMPQQGELLKVPLDGAPPVRLASTSRPFGLSWMSDGSIVFAALEGGLLKVPSGGGDPLPITKLRDGERSHRLPHVLPGGRAILYTVLTEVARWDDAFIVVEDLANGERRKLVDGADARYVQPGYLAFLQLGRMMVVPFDRHRLRVTGEPIAAEFDVMQAIGAGSEYADSGAGQFAVSETGAMAYIPGGITPQTTSTLGWVDRAGRFEPLGAPPRSYGHARLSPDGRHVALSEVGMRTAVWIYDIQRGTLIPVGLRGARAPVWAPRSGRLVVGSVIGPSVGLFWGVPHQSGDVRLLVPTTGRGILVAGAWTPDERTLLALRAGDVLAFSVLDDAVKSERKLIATPEEEAAPALSPDGRWLAYVSGAGGDGYQVLVQSFPDLKGRWQVSTAGGDAPCWGPNGTELFYVERTGRGPGAAKHMMRVTFSSGNPPTFGRPERLFEYTPYESTEPTRSFDISPDGTRFLVLRRNYPPHVPAPTRINLVLNWDQELKRRFARH